MSQEEKTIVCIFMATFNGAKFVSQQLKSFENQTIKNWELVVSDDGSTDDTLSIIQKYKDEHPTHSIKILQGPQNGFADNFLNMLKKYDGKANFFAFSDQDDIWQSHKLENAIKKLGKVPTNIPSLYCSRTEYIDQFGNSYTPPQYSRRFTLTPSFTNSLVQCLAGGNTMVFNRCSFELILKAEVTTKVPSHDWWLYQLISGCGGQIFYDPVPTVLYRQHSKNLIGGNRKIIAKINRVKMFLSGKFTLSNRSNLANLLSNEDRLEKSAQVALNQYYQACTNDKWYLRLSFFLKSNVKRQSVLENILLYFGVIFKKI